MLNKVEITNPRGDMLTLTPENPTNGFIVSAINGLDPVKATLVSSSYAKMDGSRFQSSKREERNLLFSIKYDRFVAPVRELRKILYNYLMPKSAVNFVFYVDDLVLVIDGVVESFETDLFSKEPAVVISVKCFDPDFKDLEVTTVTGVTTAAYTNTVIEYDGTVETGIVFEVHANAAISEFTAYMQSEEGYVYSLPIDLDLVAGDVVRINTNPGDKYVWLTRGGTTTSVLYAASPYAAWLQLNPGTNYFRIHAAVGNIPWNLDYVNRYGGL